MTASEAYQTVSQEVRGRVPDFFIVGHAKCGTTALYHTLRRHPQVFMPQLRGLAGKEPWFFARENPHPQAHGERDISYTGRSAMSLEEYLALFAGARPGQLIGEASTSYLWSLTAAARIHDANRDARIIAIFREPASFLRSLHMELLQKRTESEIDFRKAVELDEERRRNRHIPRRAYWPQALIYSDRVRYAEQLRRFHELFGREQVLALIYEDYRADNETTLRRIGEFLGLRDAELAPLEANTTSSTLRSMRIERARQDLRTGRGPLWRALRSTGKALTTRRVREALFYPLVRRATYREPPAQDEAFMAELRARFKPEAIALGEYLQRDLVSLWGYDEVG